MVLFSPCFNKLIARWSKFLLSMNINLVIHRNLVRSTGRRNRVGPPGPKKGEDRDEYAKCQARKIPIIWTPLKSKCYQCV